jgi:hypothetical protein
MIVVIDLLSYKRNAPRYIRTPISTVDDRFNDFILEIALDTLPASFANEMSIWISDAFDDDEELVCGLKPNELQAYCEEYHGGLMAYLAKHNITHWDLIAIPADRCSAILEVLP